jgi:hypothetical protein
VGQPGRTVKGDEVIFVFETGGRIHGLECKLTSTPSVSQIKPLERFLALVPEERRGHMLPAWTRHRGGRLGGARIVPIGQWRDVQPLVDLIET